MLYLISSISSLGKAACLILVLPLSGAGGSRPANRPAVIRTDFEASYRPVSSARTRVSSKRAPGSEMAEV